MQVPRQLEQTHVDHAEDVICGQANEPRHAGQRSLVLTYGHDPVDHVFQEQHVRPGVKEAVVVHHEPLCTEQLGILRVHVLREGNHAVQHEARVDVSVVRDPLNPSLLVDVLQSAILVTEDDETALLNDGQQKPRHDRLPVAAAHAALLTVQGQQFLGVAGRHGHRLQEPRELLP